MTIQRSIPSGGFATTVFVVALLLNAVWEIAQTPWYLVDAPFSAPHILRCLAMALADATTIVILIQIVRVAALRTAMLRDERRILLSMFFLGALVAGATEHVALAFQWWSYGERMPIIGGVGVLPTLQLAVLSPATLFVGLRLRRSSSR